LSRADSYIEKVPQLPPAPTVVVELLGLLSDPDRDLDRIVELIGHDPSLTAEVLKHCNSAFFAGASPATDMFEAVTRLGLYEVYTIVGAVVGANSMRMQGIDKSFDSTALWKHSVTTAVAATSLADYAGESNSGSFTGGLLHDIGKLVLASAEGARYSDLLRAAGSHGRAVLEAETQMLGTTHPEVAFRLLARWGLPAEISVAIMNHHASPERAAPHQRLAAVVYLANGLAHYMDGGPNKTNPWEEGPEGPEACAALDLAPEDLEAFVGRTRSGLARVHGLFKLKV